MRLGTSLTGRRMSTDVRTGSTFAGYRLDGLVGRGGMGVVYRASDPRLDRPVALKLIAPKLAENAEFHRRFLRESQLAASVDHSHIVPIYEAGDDGGQLFLAMRFVQGTDLRALLRGDGPLEPVRTLALCAQVADALDAAHDRGLVHRDVKPANILIAEEGAEEHCYLTDFGLARGRADVPQPAAAHLSGTVDYLAPEQIRGEAVEGRADQYGLACVLYECLVGEAPFHRERPIATLFAHLEDAPPPVHERRHELPEAIDRVLARGLAKDPLDRYSTCRELCDEARAALGLEPRLSRRRLLLVAGGAAVVAAAATAIPAVLLTRGGGDPRPILPLESDAVLRIDSQGTVRNALQMPSALGPIAFGESSVWLADKHRGVVSRIDPTTNAVVDEIGTTEKGDPAGLAVGDGTLWIFSSGVWTAPALRRYDLRAKRWSDVDLGGVFSENFVVADGALWSVCVKILRIDLVTGHVAATIDPGLQGKLVAAGEGAVWFAANKEPIASTGSRVWRIDPETNALGAPIEFAGTVADIAAGAGAVWTVVLEDDLVRRIDPVTVEVTEAFRVGRIPESLVAAEGAIWVTAGRDSTLTRYDPVSADLKTIDIGGTPHDMVVGADSVWVAVEATA